MVHSLDYPEYYSEYDEVKSCLDNTAVEGYAAWLL